jgi:hypothetical protein
MVRKKILTQQMIPSLPWRILLGIQGKVRKNGIHKIPKELKHVR